MRNTTKRSHLTLNLPILEKCLTLIPDAKTRLGINIAMSSVEAIFKHTPVLFHLKKTKKLTKTPKITAERRKKKYCHKKTPVLYTQKYS